MVLKNVNYFGQATNRTQIRENIIWYLRDSFINAGGYYNIASGTLGFDGTDVSLLQPSHHPDKGKFQVWKGLSHEWVWETGINATYAGGASPALVSGVYIEDVFYPTGTTGTYAFDVDYGKGAIVFKNKSFASGTKIWAERSERAAFVYPAESNEYRQIIYEHERVFNDPPGSGQDTFGSNLKAFLPAVFVDVSHGRNKAYQIGSNSHIKTFGITMEVFSEDLRQFDFLRDACIGLETQSFTMYDSNTVQSSGAYPLRYDGTLSPTPQQFSGLVDLYPWKNGSFGDLVVERKVNSPLPLQIASIKLEFEIIG